jgi:hypothetical protein
MGILDELYEQENKASGATDEAPPSHAPDGGAYAPPDSGIKPIGAPGSSTVFQRPPNEPGGDAAPEREGRFKIRGGVESPKRVRLQSMPMGILGAFGATLLMSIVWTVFAIQSRQPATWIALPMGVFVGVVAYLGARRGSNAIGLAAACIAVLGMGASKHLFFEVGIKGRMLGEARASGLGARLVAQQRLMQSGEMQQSMMDSMNDMTAGGTMMPASPSDIDTSALQGLAAEFEERIRQEAAKVTYAESEQVLDEFISEASSAMPLMKRYDLEGGKLAFLVLGALGAFLIARRSGR